MTAEAEGVRSAFAAASPDGAQLSAPPLFTDDRAAREEYGAALNELGWAMPRGLLDY